jgi:hypothetical protein
MPNYTIRNLPPRLIPMVRARAKAEGITIDAVILRALGAYIGSGTPGRAGAEARAKTLTPSQRSEIARKAAAARWDK